MACEEVLEAVSSSIFPDSGSSVAESETLDLRALFWQGRRARFRL